MTSQNWITAAVALVAAIVIALVIHRVRRRRRRRASRQDYARAYHNNLTRAQIAERARAERARFQSQT